MDEKDILNVITNARIDARDRERERCIGCVEDEPEVLSFEEKRIRDIKENIIERIKNDAKE